MESVTLNNPALFLDLDLRENKVFKVDKIRWYDLATGYGYDNRIIGEELDTVVYFYDEFICIETTIYNDGIVCAPGLHEDLIMIHKSYVLEITNPRPVCVRNIRR